MASESLASQGLPLALMRKALPEVAVLGQASVGEAPPRDDLRKEAEVPPWPLPSGTTRLHLRFALGEGEDVSRGLAGERPSARPKREAADPPSTRAEPHLVASVRGVTSTPLREVAVHRGIPFGARPLMNVLTETAAREGLVAIQIRPLQSEILMLTATIPPPLPSLRPSTQIEERATRLLRPTVDDAPRLQDLQAARQP